MQRIKFQCKGKEHYRQYNNLLNTLISFLRLFRLAWWLRGVREDSWESLVLQGDSTSPSFRIFIERVEYPLESLNIHWKGWCWSWNSNTLATWWKELTHWKRLCCWEGLGAGGGGDNRGWDGRMASLTQWTWVWVNSGSWWWTGRPGVLRFMGSQRVGQDWATELTELTYMEYTFLLFSGFKWNTKMILFFRFYFQMSGGSYKTGIIFIQY